MIINFIKSIKEGNQDSFVHKQFIRYSVGNFEREEFKINVQGKKIKLSAGFEYLNIFHRLLAQVADENIQVNGFVVTTEDIENELKNYVELKDIKRRYGKKGVKYEISGELSPEKFKEFCEKFEDYYFLFDSTSEMNKVKVKKKSTPKIGNLTEGFVKAEFDVSKKDEITKEFLFDVNTTDFKKAIIKHVYHIEDIKFDEKLIEEDPAEARKQAIRIGEIDRTVEIDGKETKSKFKFEA